MSTIGDRPPMTSEPSKPEINDLLARLEKAGDPDVLALIAEYMRLLKKFDNVEAIAIDQQFQIDDYVDRLENIADFADIWGHNNELKDEDDEPTV